MRDTKRVMKYRCLQLEARLAEARDSLEEQRNVTASMRRAAARAHANAEAAQKEVWILMLRSLSPIPSDVSLAMKVILGCRYCRAGRVTLKLLSLQHRASFRPCRPYCTVV